MLLFPFSVNLISLLGENEGQVTELNTTQVSLELSCKATTPRDFITAHGCCDLSYTYMQNDHSERKLGAAQGLLPFTFSLPQRTAALCRSLKSYWPLDQWAQ